MKRKIFAACIVTAVLLGAAAGAAWVKRQRTISIIGGADGPTAIFISKLPKGD